MVISLFLAKLLGLYFAVMSVYMVLRREQLLAVIEGLKHNPALFFLFAFMTWLFGALLILLHNVWVLDWRLMITLLAWVTFFAGMARLFFPEKLFALLPLMTKNYVYHTLVISQLFLSVYCLYHGFYG